MSSFRHACGLTILAATFTCHGPASATTPADPQPAPLATIPLTDSAVPPHRWAATQNGAPGKSSSFLGRFLDRAASNADPNAPKPAAPATAPAPAAPPLPPPFMESKPAMAPAPVPEAPIEPMTNTSATPDPMESKPRAAAEPRTPDSISVPNLLAARIPEPWTGLRVTEPATDDDIAAFQDAPNRQPRPSSSIVFFHIDHGDTESPLAPPNRSTELLNYAARARTESPRRVMASFSAPLMQVTTTSGRSFTGRATLQGNMWLIELPDGSVINLQADRVASANPIHTN